MYAKLRFPAGSFSPAGASAKYESPEPSLGGLDHTGFFVDISRGAPCLFGGETISQERPSITPAAVGGGLGGEGAFRASDAFRGERVARRQPVVVGGGPGERPSTSTLTATSPTPEPAWASTAGTAHSVPPHAPVGP